MCVCIYIYIHTHKGILLSHKKKRIWVGSVEVDEPRVCYTKWSKSEREKQISHINVYMWNLEKWYRQPYLQNRDANVENKCMATRGEREELGDWKWHIYTIDTMYGIDNQWEHTI